MNRDLFLAVWHDELQKLAPTQEGESHLLSEFRASPVVQSCLIALELTKDDIDHQLVLFEENLKTLLEMKSLSFAGRNLVDGIVKKIQLIQEARRQ
jgi:hypothetical protein